jgi:hypothetical protein
LYVTLWQVLQPVLTSVMCVLCCLLLQAEVVRLSQATAAAAAECAAFKTQATQRHVVVCALQGEIDGLKSRLATAQQKLQESQRKQEELEENAIKVSSHVLASLWVLLCTNMLHVLLSCWGWMQCNGCVGKANQYRNKALRTGFGLRTRRMFQARGSEDHHNFRGSLGATLDDSAGRVRSMLRYRFLPTLTPFAPPAGIIACQAPPYQFERFSTLSAIGATVPRCHWYPIVSGACQPASLVAQQGVAVDYF